MSRADIDRLAEEAAKQWTGKFIPRPVSVQEFAALYGSAFQARGEPVNSR